MTQDIQEPPGEELHNPAKRGEVLLKVANSTDAHKLATSIQRNVEAGKRVVVSCVGVMTVNQAVKSVAISNGRTAPLGFVLLMLPIFHTEHKEENVDYTVMRFVIVKHLIGD